MDTQNITPISELPPELQLKMREYAAFLRGKYPKWSMQRVANKVAVRFKIKLVDREKGSIPISAASQKNNSGK